MKDLMNFYNFLVEKKIIVPDESNSLSAKFWAEKFIKALPQKEAGSVSLNEKDKGVCEHDWYFGKHDVWCVNCFTRRNEVK